MHTIQFAHNKIAGTFRATCSCGWMSYDTDKTALQCRAACHDLNDEAPSPKQERAA